MRKIFTDIPFLITSLLVTSLLLHTNLTYSQPAKYATPLEQFKMGTSASSIKCNDDLHLVIKADDGSPACVKSNTASILLERGWAYETSSQTSKNITMSTSSTSCDTPYPANNHGFLTNASFSVMYIPMNSTGKLCVQYYSSNDLPFVPITIFDANSTDENKNATGITISSFPNAIPKETYTTVVYTIKTGNYSGFYGLRIVCWEFPFAIGYDDHSITSNDFAGIVHFPMCSGVPLDYNITGLSGINIKMIH